LKTIGLSIAIGASVAGALSGIRSVQGSSLALGEKLNALGKSKIDIIANDKSVVSVTNKLKRLESRVSLLKKRKIELQAKLNTAKSQEEVEALKEKIVQTTRRITVMNNNKFTLKNKLKEARTEAEKTNKAVLKISATIAKINSTKLKIQRTIEQRNHFKSNIVGTAAKVATVAMPIKTGIEFESSMARVKAITMATDTQFKSLESTALKLGSSTTFSSTQVAQGMQYLSMAGFKTNQTIKAMPGVLNLASAGALDLASTSDIASNVLSGFGIKAEKMGMVADVMAKATTSSNLGISELGETMKNAAPSASALGASIYEVTALSGKLADIGIKGGDAGTALKIMYLRMASPPKEAQKVIASLGLQTKDAKGNFIGMTNLLGQLHKKTKNMTNVKKSDYMKKLFGSEAIGASIALTEKADGTLKKYVKTLEESSGFAQKMADIQNNTTAGALKRLSSAIEGISIKFSKIFTPAINSVADSLSGLGTWFGEMMDKHEKLTKVVVIGATAFLTTGVVVGTLTVALGFAMNGLRALRLGMLIFTPIMKAKTVAMGTATLAVKAYGLASTLAVGGLKMLGRTIAFVGRAMLLNPIGLAVTAIAGGAYLIYEYWEPISGFFGSLWDGVKGIFSSVWSGIKSTVSFAWEGIKTLFNWSPLGIIVNNWQSILGFFGGIGEGVKNLFSVGWNGLKNALSWNPLDFVVAKWNGLSNFFANFSLKDAGSKIIGSVVDGMTATWGKLTKKVGDITKSIRDFFPFSPAKRGALTDIHKIKLMETVASGLNDKPLLNAVNNTTKKMRKALVVGSVGMALSGTLAASVPKSLGSVGNGSVAQREVSTNSLISNMSDSENIASKNSNGDITVHVNFGDTHIHTDTDKEEFLREVEQRVQQALRDAQREKQNIRMYD